MALDARALVLTHLQGLELGHPVGRRHEQLEGVVRRLDDETLIASTPSEDEPSRSRRVSRSVTSWLSTMAAVASARTWLVDFGFMRGPSSSGPCR